MHNIRGSLTTRINRINTGHFLDGSGELKSSMAGITIADAAAAAEKL